MKDHTKEMNSKPKANKFVKQEKIDEKLVEIENSKKNSLHISCDDVSLD